MSTFQRVGGYAAWLQGLAFLVLIGIIFGVLAPQGVGVPGADPSKTVAFAANSPTPFQIQNLISVLIGVTIVLFTLALRERMQANAPHRMRLAVVAASVASALFLATGMVSFVGFPPIVSQTDTAAALSGFRILNAVTSGLRAAALFAAGWSALLLAWAALSTRSLPTVLSYLLALGGAVAILSFVVPLLALIGIVINVVWSLWLGYVLVRVPMSMTAPTRTKA